MNRKISTVLLLFAFSAGAFAREEVTRAFDKTVPLQPGQRVSVEHSFGDIDIHTHAAPQVVVRADIKVSASDANEANSYANNIAILVEPSSEGVSIRTRYPERPHSFMGLKNVSYTVHYQLTVPEAAAVAVHSSFGNVTATGIKAASEIKMSHGNLVFRNGRGSQRLGNAFGGVEVSDNDGDVTIENNNGDVKTSNIAGALDLRDRFGSVIVNHVGRALKISNSNGSVRITDCGSPANINNAFGSVNISDVRGDLTVHNSNGTVEANSVTGSAELNSSFGAVRYSNVGGHVSVSSNNSDVVGRKSGPLNVRASFGKVDAGDVQGEAQIVTANGAVSLVNASGSVNIRDSFGLVRTENTGSLTVDNANGGVSATNVRGDANVRTSFAAVLLDGVSGSVNAANQNGAVDVTATADKECKPISIRTSFSPVRLRLPANGSYRISATTSFGKINSEIPMNVTGSISSDSLSGSIGGGKCELRIVNNNGNIDLLRSTR